MVGKLNISNVNSLFNNAIDRHQSNNNSINNVVEIDIKKIKLNKFQNRQVMSNIDELANSIKNNGIIQPLIVNAGDIHDEKPYELVNGERRLKAAEKARLQKVPVIIRNLSDKQIINFTLAENLQREDLNPVEIANGYKTWLDINNGTYEQLAKAMNKSLGTIGSYMKIIQMDVLLQEALKQGKINLKQALEIDKLIDKSDLSDVINVVYNDQLTVKATSDLIKKINGKKNHKKVSNVLNSKKARDYQHELSEKYGNGVFKITQKKANKTGKIEIKFKNDEELNHLFDLFNDKSCNFMDF